MDDELFWRHCQIRGLSAHTLRAMRPRPHSELPSLDPGRLQYWQRARQRYALIRCIDPEYPSALLELDRPPKQLWLLGKPELLHRSMTAIVGSRDASIHGRAIAELTASIAGDCIVSGGARGIDQVAHQAALPHTIAVMGGGLDHLFPPQCRSLLDQIAQTGLIISEQFPDVPPKGGLFPARNRVIAALCHRLLVVEGHYQSGSLITAQAALELGREVWAVPGSPLSPLAQGPNRLIRDGAHPFTEAADWQAPDTVLKRPDDPFQDALGANAHTPSELSCHLSIPLAQVLTRLMELKLAGKVAVRAGRYAWKF